MCVSLSFENNMCVSPFSQKQHVCFPFLSKTTCAFPLSFENNMYVSPFFRKQHVRFPFPSKTTCAFPLSFENNMCVSPFFRKAISFFIELLVLVSLPNHSMSNIRSIPSLVFLKVFWNLWNTSRKSPTIISKRSEVFYKIGILKKSATFLGKQQCWSHFLRKSLEIEGPAQVFCWEYSETLKNIFFTEHLRSDRVGLCLWNSCTLQALTERFLSD